MTVKPDLRAVLEFYHVELRGERREVQILCPVHDENRPSCSVNLDKGVIHCMSCGFGGDAFDIIAKKEGLEDAPFGDVVGAAERIFGGSYQRSEPSRRPQPRGRERGAGFRPAFKRKRILS